MCLTFCMTPLGERGWAYRTCHYIKVFEMLSEIANDIWTIVEGDWWVGKEDYCQYIK